MEFSAAGLYIYVISLLLLIVPLAIFYFESRNRSTSGNIPIPPPTEIVQLRVYPIKSCRGFQVKSTKLFKNSLDLDRCWMFIDAEKRAFLTIRQINKMTLIDTALSDDDELVISIRDSEPAVKMSIPAHPSQEWLETNTQLTKVTIWKDDVDGWEYSASLTAPFSKFFDRDVRLVYKGPTPRICRSNASPKVLGRTQDVNFPDVMPLQIASLASLDELNSRLAAAGDKPISIERFRPNIVVKGTEPWAEDVWKTVRIIDPTDESEPGRPGMTIDVAARCARCRVPNVDPDTAEQHQKQPWDMLMGYRRVDEGIKFKPCFGMLCVPREEGVVEVGMKLVVTEVTGEHRYVPAI